MTVQYDGKEKCVQVEALIMSEKPVAVTSLMEKFPLDLCIILHVVQILGGVLPYMAMCRCEGFKQFTLG